MSKNLKGIFRLRRDRVLIAINDPEMSVRVSDILRKEYDVITAKDGRDVIQTCRRMHVDALVIHFDLLDIAATEVIRLLRSRQELNSTPILLLSALKVPEDEIKLLDAGADDYLVEPFDDALLLARVRAHLRSNTRVDNMMSKMVGPKVEGYAANHYFSSMAHKEFDVAVQTDGWVSLACITIDSFDRYEHLVGVTSANHVLQRICVALRHTLNIDRDMITMFGRGEFVVLLPGSGRAAAARFARNALSNVSRLGILTGQGFRNHYVSISIGVSSNEAHHYESIQQMLSDAMISMGDAQAVGGNTWFDMDRKGDV